MTQNKLTPEEKAELDRLTKKLLPEPWKPLSNFEYWLGTRRWTHPEDKRSDEDLYEEYKQSDECKAYEEWLKTKENQ